MVEVAINALIYFLDQDVFRLFLLRRGHLGKPREASLRLGLCPMLIKRCQTRLSPALTVAITTAAPASVKISRPFACIYDALESQLARIQTAGQVLVF